MYRLEVSATFSAAHALRFGRPVQFVEPMHGHDFRVTVTLEGPALDDDGLLVDFHRVERALGEILAPLHNRPLNETPPFDRTNPSAEHIARHIGLGISRWIETQAREHPKEVPGGGAPPSPTPIVRLHSVRVTEAVGCIAEYRPDR